MCFAQPIKQSVERRVCQQDSRLIEHVGERKTELPIGSLIDGHIQDWRYDLRMRVDRHVFHDVTVVGMCRLCQWVVAMSSLNASVGVCECLGGHERSVIPWTNESDERTPARESLDSRAESMRRQCRPRGSVLLRELRVSPDGDDANVALAALSRCCFYERLHLQARNRRDVDAELLRLIEA